MRLRVCACLVWREGTAWCHERTALKHMHTHTHCSNVVVTN